MKQVLRVGGGRNKKVAHWGADLVVATKTYSMIEATFRKEKNEPEGSES